MYTDRPLPSFPYLLFLALGTMLSALPLFINVLQHASPILLILVTLPVVLMLLLDIAAFCTRYRVDVEGLEVRAWPLFRKRVAWADIQGIERVGMIRRVVGWAPGQVGCCNRLTEGLAVFLPRGVLYISPTDRLQMELLLRERAISAARTSSTELPWMTDKSLRLTLLLLAIPALTLVVLAVPLVLGLVPPNELLGVRTRSTLQDPALWYAANFRGGWCMAAAGLFSLATTALAYRSRERLGSGRAAGLSIAVMLVGVIGAAVLSLLLIPS